MSFGEIMRLCPDLFTEDNCYVRCSRCESGYASKEFTDDSIDNQYDEYYEFEGSLKNVYFNRESKHILRIAPYNIARLARFKPSGKFLDIGSGRGEFLQRVQDTGRYECTGLDVSSKAARYAEELFGLRIKVAHLDYGIFGEEKFDVVYLRHIIEHINEPHEFLKKIKSVCAPEAVLVFHVPNDLSFTNSFKRFLYRLGRSPECGSLCYPYHLVGYNPVSLSYLLESEGLIVHLVPVDIPLLPFSILDTLPGRGHVMVSYFKVRGDS